MLSVSIRTVRLIVAEDDPVTADILRFKLTSSSRQVHVARHGEEAWTQLVRGFDDGQPADLLVTDHQMPRLSGVDLIRRVRGDCRFAGLPVILCSAKGLELRAGAELADLGINKVVYKPFSPRQVVQMVEELLSTAAATAATDRVVREQECV